MRIYIEVPEPVADTIEYETTPGQRAAMVVEEGLPVLYLNQKACLFLARLFAQLAHGAFSTGCDLHFGQDFDPEAPETFRIIVTAKDTDE